jgi:hypothetical protein
MRSMNFVVGVPRIYRLPRSDSTPSVSWAPPSPTYLLLLPLASTLTLSARLTVQQIIAAVHPRSTALPEILQLPPPRFPRHNRRGGSRCRAHLAQPHLVEPSPS